MEKEGLVRSLDFLERSGLQADVLVTDRHPQVQKYVREHKPEIMHYYDVWHCAKGISKKLEKLAKERDCDIVGRWRKSIINHLYYVAATSHSPQERIAKWTSVLNHVQNVHYHHNEHFPACLHEPMDKNDRMWLQPITKACQKLEDIITRTGLLKDVQKLRPLHQTSNLESFHSLILKFAPKNVAFSYKGMLCRLQLATMHFNENADRCQARGSDGELAYEIRFPKVNRGAYSVRTRKTPPTYDYVDKLLELLYDEVVVNPANYQELLEELVVPSHLCSKYPRPVKSEAVANYHSRYSHTSSSRTGSLNP